MGLMLSILVVCVGVIEALSCYEHFQYGVLHCATSIYENARRRSSVFLNYTSRRLKLLSEDSIAEDDDDEGSSSRAFALAAEPLDDEKPKKIKKAKSLEKQDKIEIVKKLLEKPKRPKTVRSISMPALIVTERDLELSKIINELANESVEEVNVEIDIDDPETVLEEFDKLFGEPEGRMNYPKIEENQRDVSPMENGGSGELGLKDNKDLDYERTKGNLILETIERKDLMEDESVYHQPPKFLTANDLSRKTKVISRLDKSTSIDFDKMSLKLSKSTSVDFGSSASPVVELAKEMISRAKSTPPAKIEVIVDVSDQTFDELFGDLEEESPDELNSKYKEIEEMVIGALDDETMTHLGKEYICSEIAKYVEGSKAELEKQETVESFEDVGNNQSKAFDEFAERVVGNCLEEMKRLVGRSLVLNSINPHLEISSAKPFEIRGFDVPSKVIDVINAGNRPEIKLRNGNNKDISLKFQELPTKDFPEERQLDEEVVGGNEMKTFEQKWEEEDSSRDLENLEQSDESTPTGSTVTSMSVSSEEPNALVKSLVEISGFDSVMIVGTQIEDPTKTLSAARDQTSLALEHKDRKQKLEPCQGATKEVIAAPCSVEGKDKVEEASPSADNSESIIKTIKSLTDEPSKTLAITHETLLAIEYKDRKEAPEPCQSIVSEIILMEWKTKEINKEVKETEKVEEKPKDVIDVKVEEKPKDVNDVKVEEKPKNVIDVKVEENPKNINDVKIEKKLQKEKEVEGKSEKEKKVEAKSEKEKKVEEKCNVINDVKLEEKLKETKEVNKNLEKEKDEEKSEKKKKVEAKSEKEKEVEAKSEERKELEKKCEVITEVKLEEKLKEAKQVDKNLEKEKEVKAKSEKGKEVEEKSEKEKEVEAKSEERKEVEEKYKVITEIKLEEKRKETTQVDKNLEKGKEVVEKFKVDNEVKLEEKLKGATEVDEKLEKEREMEKFEITSEVKPKEKLEIKTVTEKPRGVSETKVEGKLKEDKVLKIEEKFEKEKDVEEKLKVVDEVKLEEKLKENKEGEEKPRGVSELKAKEKSKEAKDLEENFKDFNGVMESEKKTKEQGKDKETENKKTENEKQQKVELENFENLENIPEFKVENLEVKIESSRTEGSTNDERASIEVPKERENDLQSQKTHAEKADDGLGKPEVTKTQPPDVVSLPCVEPSKLLAIKFDCPLALEYKSGNQNLEVDDGDVNNVIALGWKEGKPQKQLEVEGLILGDAPEAEVKATIPERVDKYELEGLVVGKSVSEKLQMEESKPETSATEVQPLKIKPEEDDFSGDSKRKLEITIEKTKTNDGVSKPPQSASLSNEGISEDIPQPTDSKKKLLCESMPTSSERDISAMDVTNPQGNSPIPKDNKEQRKSLALKEGKQANSAPEAFWLIFSGEYTKAMSKDWHSGHFSCWQCDEALTGQRYVLRDDHPYCIKCYESVFANVCEECNKIIGIDSKDLSYKDKHWHEACFLCNKCRVSLVDKQFGSKADKIYCGNCYDAQFASRCDGCGEIFRAGTKKMEYKTRQWHEKCFCCCVCKTPIGTKSFIPREQEIYCATCYEEKFATRCVKCNKIITSGGVTYKNEPWHRECFTCTNCNTSLAGQRFTSRDEKPYCADCFGELFAKRCTACSRPITGIGGTRFISFEDRHWHNDCFICASCKTSLVGRGFITDGDDIICPECAKQKLM